MSGDSVFLCVLFVLVPTLTGTYHLIKDQGITDFIKEDKPYCIEKTIGKDTIKKCYKAVEIE